MVVVSQNTICLKGYAKPQHSHVYRSIPYANSRSTKRKDTSMNAVDVLTYGHGAVQQAVNDLSDSAWKKAGACGFWSVKDIIAHLTSFEYVLKEVLMTIIEGEMRGSTPSAATPHLNRFMECCAQLNL